MLTVYNLEARKLCCNQVNQNIPVEYLYICNQILFHRKDVTQGQF